MAAVRKIRDRESYLAAWKASTGLITSGLNSFYRMVKIELRLLFHQ